uniref:Uncharacterized protein n=1 Tax=Arundo donax TaxID=35708 RepID=A0A0A9A8W0_ARUDO
MASDPLLPLEISVGSSEALNGGAPGKETTESPASSPRLALMRVRLRKTARSLAPEA